MGKAILLLLTAFSIGGITMAMQSWSTERAADEDQIVEHAQMLAREIALSAYAIGVDRVKASFFERPIQGNVAFENVQFGEGYYDLYLIEMPSSTIRVTARGRMRVPIPDVANGLPYTERTHTVQGDFVGLNEPPGALVVDAPVLRFNELSSGGTEWRIIGDDTRPPIPCDPLSGLSAGRGLATSAVHTTRNDPIQYAQLQLALSGNTPGGNPTITQGAIGTYFTDAYIQARQMAANGVTPGSRVINASSTTFTPADNTMLGSPTIPIAIEVNGNVRLNNNVRGYGVLIVHGNLEMRLTSSWEGVVFVVGSGTATIELKNESKIIGGLFARVTDSGGVPGRLNFNIRDQAQLLSSAEGIGILSNYLPAFNEVSRVEPLTERHTPATSFLSSECSGDDDPPPPPPPGDGGSGGGSGGSDGGGSGGGGTLGGEDGAPRLCGCREGKVGVMHYPRNGNAHLICIAPAAVRAHTIAPHHWAWNGESDYVVCPN